MQAGSLPHRPHPPAKAFFLHFGGQIPRKEFSGRKSCLALIFCFQITIYRAEQIRAKDPLKNQVDAPCFRRQTVFSAALKDTADSIHRCGEQQKDVKQEKEREQGNDHNKKQDACNKNSRKNWNIAYFQQHPPKKDLFPAESSSRQKKSIYGAKKHHSPKKAKTDRQKIKILRHIHPKQEIRSNHHGQHGYLLHGMVRLLFLYAEL